MYTIFRKNKLFLNFYLAFSQKIVQKVFWDESVSSLIDCLVENYISIVGQN